MIAEFEVMGATSLANDLRRVDSRLRDKSYRRALRQANKPILASLRRATRKRERAYGDALRTADSPRRRRNAAGRLTKAVKTRVRVNRREHSAQAFVQMYKRGRGGNRWAMGTERLTRAQRDALQAVGFIRRFGPLRAWIQGRKRPPIRPIVRKYKDKVAKTYAKEVQAAMIGVIGRG